MSFEVFIGLRYLFSRKGDFLVSIITFISIIGVMLGVAAPIVVLSVVTGFENDFRDKILGNNSHLVVIEWGSRTMTDYDDVVQKALTLSEVRGASPFIYQEALLQGKSDRSSGVLIYGVDPDKVTEVISIGDDLVFGDVSSLKSEEGLPSIILGAELANHSLFLIAGDEVDILSPTGEISPFGMGPKIRRFKVTGIFKSGLYEYDARTAYISLATAQRFFSLEDRVSGVQVSLHDADKALVVSELLQKKLGDRFVVRTWMEMNRDLFSAFKLERTVFFIVMTMIIVVAAFNIIGTLILVVTEKNREIAVLKAIGAQRLSIVKIFMATGSIIGGIGTALGLVLGWVVIILLRDVIHFPLNANVYQVENLPVSINGLNFLLVGLAGMLISFLATLYPSIKAGSLNTSEGLRYE